MAASEPPRLTIVQPGAGPTGVLGSIGVGFQPWGEETGGALSIVEHPFPVGALVGAHLHTREDEYTIVTEGEIGFRSGEREVVLGSGGYITKPRGEMRAMWNASDGTRLAPAHPHPRIDPGVLRKAVANRDIRGFSADSAWRTRRRQPH